MKQFYWSHEEFCYRPKGTVETLMFLWSGLPECIKSLFQRIFFCVVKTRLFRLLTSREPCLKPWFQLVYDTIKVASCFAMTSTSLGVSSLCQLCFWLVPHSWPYLSSPISFARQIAFTVSVKICKSWGSFTSQFAGKLQS